MAINDLFDELFGPENSTAGIENSTEVDEFSDAGNNFSEHEEEFDGEDFLEHGPQLNMEFESRESLFDAYQIYGKHQGFAVSTRNFQGNKYIMICCDRGRKSDVKKHTKRVDCPARISAIKQDNGCWRVSKVEPTHNHELVPDMTIFMPGHRSMTINMKRQLENNDISGIRPCKNLRLLEVQAGGPQNLGCTSKDVRNFIEARRRLRLGEGDAAAIHNLFMRLQQKDRSFFHLMDINDEGRLCNVMWIHPRSRATYEDFHDVISFDTTYLVNKYHMPFATVVGINHHYQSILLGCALLTHEDAESFKWFWRNWLAAMGGVQPTAILTDQCESIKISLREIMPNTIHRFCRWHIVSKIPKKLKGVRRYHDVVKDFNAMIYHCLSIDEFESRWDNFLEEYSLRSHRWLKDLYEERDKWVPIYLNHVFWAGMVSTQRSESMHAFFDGYITPMSTLKAFVEQYEIAVSNKIHKELEADFQSKYTHIKRRTIFEWEDHLGRVYTNNVFKLVQGEIDKIMNCNLKHLDDTTPEIERYEISELGIIDNSFHKEYSYIVEYRPTGEYFQCDCRKFESKGILCVR